MEYSCLLRSGSGSFGIDCALGVKLKFKASAGSGAESVAAGVLQRTSFVSSRKVIVAYSM